MTKNNKVVAPTNNRMPYSNLFQSTVNEYMISHPSKPPQQSDPRI
jgi:hypothetical protein